MDNGSMEVQRAARAAAYSIPIEEIDPANAELFRTDTHWPYFERLRKEDPVHWAVSPAADIGGYWSITKYNDIVAVETDHMRFSSGPIIVLKDQADNLPLKTFIAMDPPKHGEQRKTVSPIVSPASLMRMEPLIRERAGAILDNIPVGEPFDWVHTVSIELTNMTLATLFAFPWEDRHKLTRWSDVATAEPDSGLFDSSDPEKVEAQRTSELLECLEYFTRLWNERVNAPPKPDLISMLAHSDATRNMDRMEYLGNIVVLIVGGSDTTRNSMSGSVWAQHLFPDQERILRADPSLIPAMVSESIRWQSPVGYMRRTALEDVEFKGKTIRAGDKVAMWYVSGNRDEEVIDRPNDYWIERPRVRQHLSFGAGIHRCLGNRLGELQLKIIWEEILARFPKIEVVGSPRFVPSPFVKGYEYLPVMIPSRN